MSNRNPERTEDSRAFTVYRGKDDFKTVDERFRQTGLSATLKFIFTRVASRLGWWSYYLYHRSFDRRFDRQHGVDTCGIMFNDKLTVVGNNRASGLEYEPTPVRSFNKMLTEIKEDLSDFTFIDFGCGKGRTLLLASHDNFNKIRGVEFVKEIQEIATRNIAIYRPENQQCRDIEAVLCDAAEFEIPDDNCVFYFYFPFREDVLRVVMNNIVASYRGSPRKMYFVVRLDKPEWTEITQRVFSEYAVLQPFGRQPDLSGVRVMPFDVIYYKTPKA
jgi:SAM-dependent methyltransferase